MLLSSTSIPDIQKAIELGREVPPAKKGQYSASLPALLSLAVSSRAASDRSDTKAREFFVSLGIPRLAELVQLLGSNSRQRAENDFGTYSFEAYRIGSKQDLLGDDWTYFCDRFRRAASRGKSSPAIVALLSVFREMADNVPCHAYATASATCRALAGYHVTTTGTAFSVVDDGQGFLRSLTQNPVWNALRSDREALDAVVSRQATCRVGEATGGGFKQLFNGLLNLDGVVVLRSGASSFTLRNNSFGWERNESVTHFVPGSQVTFYMDKNGNPLESAI